LHKQAGIEYQGQNRKVLCRVHRDFVLWRVILAIPQLKFSNLLSLIDTT